MDNTLTVTTPYELDGDLFFSVEWDDDGVCTENISDEHLEQLLLTGKIDLEYNQDAEAPLATVVKSLGMRYIELDEDADGSGEHDIYIHKAMLKDGRLMYDKNGELYKTYKSLAYAKKCVAKLQAREL